MKILHLSTLPYGGAGVACMRLHEEMLNSGIDSKVLTVLDSTIPMHGHFSLRTTVPDFDKSFRNYKRKQITDGILVRFNGKTRELFSFPDSGFRTEDHPLVKEADVIHLHWVAGMIDVTRFFATVKKPIVWTLHDAWPFTGGFHYDQYWDWKNFNSLCAKNLEVKKLAYANKVNAVIGPSEYVLNHAKKSNVFSDAQCYHIPYSIPSAIFSPALSREVSRRKYGADENKFVCVYGSDELDYFRKGADLLLEAFIRWDNPQVRLIIAGKKGKQTFPEDSRIQFTGRISSETEMAELLGAADVLVHTSREDNLPNIILESLFCGTPVLATPVGGVTEIIVPNVNGILSADTSSSSVLAGLKAIAGAKFDAGLISRNAQAKYAGAIQARKVLEVYRQILSFQ